MTHIAPNLAQYLPPSYVNANGELSVSQSDAERVAKMVQRHVQSLPAAEADLFLALLQTPDLGPKKGAVPEDLEARLNGIETAVKLFSDFIGLAEDLQQLAKLIVMHVNDQQKSALDNRLAAREEAKTNQLRQSKEMNDSADEMMSGAVTNLVIAVVSAAVALGMAGGSAALSARAAGRLNDMQKVAPPKVQANNPKATPNANPQPTPNANSQPTPNATPGQTPGTTSSQATASPEAVPGATPESVSSTPTNASSQENANTNSTNEGEEITAEPDVSVETTTTATAAAMNATGTPAVVPTPGGGSGGSSQTGGSGSGTGQSDNPDGSSNLGQVDADATGAGAGTNPQDQFHADLKGQELEMAQINTLTTKAQNLGTIGGIVNSLGQAGAGYASTSSQAESKRLDAEGAVYAATAEQANAAGDMAKAMQDSMLELLNKIVQLLHDLQSAKAEQMNNFTRV